MIGERASMLAQIDLTLPSFLRYEGERDREVADAFDIAYLTQHGSSHCWRISPGGWY